MTDFLVHIGTNKTGTSSLQRVFFENRAVLRDNGIIYPLTGLDNAAHHNLSRAVKGADLASLGMKETWAEDLRTECEGFVMCLLSSENFHTIRDPGRLAAICPLGRTRIILYIRDHVAHMVSWYQQAVQTRNTAMTLSEFIEHHSYSYSDLIAKWVAVYGKDNVIVRLYDRASLKNHDIISDFLNFTSPDIEPLLTLPPQASNPSISGNLLFVKRVMNCFITEAESLSVANELAGLTNLDPSFIGKVPADQRQVRRINFLSRDDRQRLADEYAVRMRPRNKPIEGVPFPDSKRLAADFARILARAEQRGFRIADLMHRMQAMFKKA